MKQEHHIIGLMLDGGVYIANALLVPQSGTSYCYKLWYPLYSGIRIIMGTA